MTPMLTPTQCVMARYGLGLTVRELAAGASLGVATVNRFELGQAVPEASTMRLLRMTLEAAGAVFIGSDGVRIPKGAADGNDAVRPSRSAGQGAAEAVRAA